MYLYNYESSPTPYQHEATSLYYHRYSSSSRLYVYLLLPFLIHILYNTLPRIPHKHNPSIIHHPPPRPRILTKHKTNPPSFPETKELKKRVRDLIDPSRDLGHVDGKKKSVPAASGTKRTDSAAEAGERARPTGSKVTSGGDVGGEGKGEMKRNADGSVCEDCN